MLKFPQKDELLSPLTYLLIVTVTVFNLALTFTFIAVYVISSP